MKMSALSRRKKRNPVPRGKSAAHSDPKKKKAITGERGRTNNKEDSMDLRAEWSAATERELGNR